MISRVTSILRRASLSAKVTTMIVLALVALAISLWMAASIIVDRDAREDAMKAQEQNLRVGWDVVRSYGQDLRVEGDVLYAGRQPLNNLDAAVDRIKELVGGNVTIFRGDTRIATTVRKEDGTRAVGTRMGDDAREAVLNRGQRFVGENEVLGVRYFSVYDPIRDSSGRVIGCLFVGVPFDEFMAAPEQVGRSIAIVSLVVMLIAAALCMWGTRVMFGPLTAMRGTMQDLSRGRFDIEVKGADRADEIGRMAEALVIFRDAGIAKEKAEAAQREAEAGQRFVVDMLQQSLDSLSQGDLTADIRADFPPAYGQLKSNFNGALASLRELIGSVMESAHNLRTGSSEIAQASEDLARRTESNAASLEETSAALHQIDGRIKATAEAAGRTVVRADEAITTVSDGRSIADEAVQAMSRVRVSAKGIDEVIEGVDKIAFQTRVLAMNAAVEAGRAGDAGRGFAVVADLVSALAMRAEEEAKRARDQLTVTQTDIVTAVEAVTRIDGALTDISSGVGEVHELLGNMAQDNQAQATAITQISSAVNAMDQATQQNAAMVEETSAAARNLNVEAEGLADKASQFRTDDGDGRRMAASTAATDWAHDASAYAQPVKPLSPAAVSALTRPAS